MKIENIKSFATRVTYTYNRTTVTFKNGTKMVGFFESTDSESMSKNKWNFVPLQQVNNERKMILIDGESISNIEIVDLRVTEKHL